MGTDDGTMNAFVADYTADDIGEVETYFNIPIGKDSVGYFEAISDDTNENNLVMDKVTYSNMERKEDIPTDSNMGRKEGIPTSSKSNGVWIWVAGGAITCGIILIVILKKKANR